MYDISLFDLPPYGAIRQLGTAPDFIQTWSLQARVNGDPLCARGYQVGSNAIRHQGDTHIGLDGVFRDFVVRASLAVAGNDVLGNDDDVHVSAKPDREPLLRRRHSDSPQTV